MGPSPRSDYIARRWLSSRMRTFALRTVPVLMNWLRAVVCPAALGLGESPLGSILVRVWQRARGWLGRHGRHKAPSSVVVRRWRDPLV